MVKQLNNNNNWTPYLVTQPKWVMRRKQNFKRTKKKKLGN
uniref:Uncharacterized protein n=1 Tax=Gossypium raimondii TaxID=29730 RepID=A0A0D2MCJ4_GOSRA|nr:hypothetical protein B456_002G179100 [Gossypium raimondii]